jgi:hypothetical protein
VPALLGEGRNPISLLMDNSKYGSGGAKLSGDDGSRKFSDRSMGNGRCSIRMFRRTSWARGVPMTGG